MQQISLLEHAVSSIADAGDEHLKTHFDSIQSNGEPGQQLGLPARVMRRVSAPLAPRSATVRSQRQRVSRSAATSVALSYFECWRELALPLGANCDELLVAACVGWHRTDAIAFAREWLLGEPRDQVDSPGEANEMGVIVGIAAAAAVACAIVLVARGESIFVGPCRRRLSPSSDHRALSELVLTQSGPQAAIAQQLLERAAAPWSWSLAGEVTALPADEMRTLLRCLGSSDLCDVTVIAPESGTALDLREVSPTEPGDPESQWLIDQPVAEGFRVGPVVVLRAQATVCTPDAWVLFGTDCTVGRFIRSQAEQLVPGGTAGLRKWRAPWGLTHPEDLRLRFSEEALDRWRRRVSEELAGYYPEQPERRLGVTGKAGDVFELSTMETASGHEPVGDTMVESVVERDGVPQHGLASPGGSPLLLAVVHLREVP